MNNIKKTLLVICSLVLFSSVCSAQTATEKSVEKLFALTDMDQLLNSAYAQMDGMFAQMSSQMELTEAQKPVMDKFFKKYTELVREELSWKKLKAPMISSYQQVFSEPEVKELIEFYQSPLGKKLLEKMPQLMEVSMQMMQQSMADMMPKIQVLQQELEQELGKADSAN